MNKTLRSLTLSAIVIAMVSSASPLTFPAHANWPVLKSWNSGSPACSPQLAAIIMPEVAKLEEDLKAALAGENVKFADLKTSVLQYAQRIVPIDNDGKISPAPFNINGTDVQKICSKIEGMLKAIETAKAKAVEAPVQQPQTGFFSNLPGSGFFSAIWDGLIQDTEHQSAAFDSFFSRKKSKVQKPVVEDSSAETVVPVQNPVVQKPVVKQPAKMIKIENPAWSFIVDEPEFIEVTEEEYNAELNSSFSTFKKVLKVAGVTTVVIGGLTYGLDYLNVSHVPMEYAVAIMSYVKSFFVAKAGLCDLLPTFIKDITPQIVIDGGVKIVDLGRWILQTLHIPTTH